MAPKLYMALTSPPVRAVLMCAKAIGLELELVELDIFHGEQLNPDFLKLNPLQTVPTMDDDGFILTDSNAIMGYLMGMYAKDDSLYPKDVKKQAAINQKLFFNSSIFFERGRRLVFSILVDGMTVITEAHVKSIDECYGFIEVFLQDSKYLAGDNLSIADFSVITTLINANLLLPLSENKYPKTAAWRKAMEALPYYDINRVGEKIFKTALETKLKG